MTEELESKSLKSSTLLSLFFFFFRSFTTVLFHPDAALHNCTEQFTHKEVTHHLTLTVALFPAANTCLYQVNTKQSRLTFWQPRPPDSAACIPLNLGDWHQSNAQKGTASPCVGQLAAAEGRESWDPANLL